MPIDYRYGTPSLEEWHGLWKSDPSDSEVTDVEFNGTFKSLDKWLAQYGKTGVREDCDFYVVGDCQGDKTQCVELVNPNVLTMPFLKFLQRWISEFYPKWRIVVPTYLAPHNVILAYKDSIRANREYEANLEESLAVIRAQMFALDEYKHVSRKK